jgi:phage terminase small subunit
MKRHASREGRALTPKQQRFVDEYLVDLNATQAAIRAGYSRRAAYSIGEENLKKPEIARAVAEAQAARAERVHIKADDVLRELARIAFSDIRAFFNDDGSLKRPHELGADQAAALASLESVEEFAGKGDDRKLVGYTRKVKLWEKRGALELAMRHLGMFKDSPAASQRIEITRTIIHVTRPEGVPSPDDLADY